MSITINTHKIKDIRYNTFTISKAYYNTKLVYQKSKPQPQKLTTIMVLSGNTTSYTAPNTGFYYIPDISATPIYITQGSILTFNATHTGYYVNSLGHTVKCVDEASLSINNQYVKNMPVTPSPSSMPGTTSPGIALIYYLPE